LEASKIIAESHIQRLRYQQFFEFAPDCQFLTDLSGVIVEANHAAAALLKCRKEFLIDKPLGLFVVEQFRPRFYESLMRLRSKGSDEFETRLGRCEEPREAAVRVTALERGAEYIAFRWLMRDITERRRAEAARTELLQRIVTAQEDERRRIARELHDEMGQHLTALILDLKLLGDTFSVDSPAREQLERVRREAGQIGQALHRLAVELRPTALDDLGLDVTLRNYVGDWARRSGIRAEYIKVGPTDLRLPSSVETATYRIVQEALTNVAKHAQATQVSVILERRDRSLRVIVEDNGRGFDADALMKPSLADNRLGLLGMRERVALLGGSLVVESEAGGPTSIYVDVPVAKD
jgi:PAS domain S-box-containing protein